MTSFGVGPTVIEGAATYSSPLMLRAIARCTSLWICSMPLVMVSARHPEPVEGPCVASAAEQRSCLATTLHRRAPCATRAPRQARGDVAAVMVPGGVSFAADAAAAVLTAGRRVPSAR